MLSSVDILAHLDQNQAVLTGGHFAYTNGDHGTGYVNMRKVAHQTGWLRAVGRSLAGAIAPNLPDIVMGPETLGRSLAEFTALDVGGQQAVWCEFTEDSGVKRAVFSPKLDFGRHLTGKRVAIVDDLLTTGSSIRLTTKLIREHGGYPFLAVVVVRRSPEVMAADCNVPELRVLADIPGFATFTPQECATHGPCSQHVPMRLRPGHGHKWILSHPGYPTA